MALLGLVLAAPLCWAQAPNPPPAPAHLKPVLDEAAALEHRGEFAAARALYTQALATVPGSRHAQLGLARIARADYRFGEAGAIYEQLLQADPGDLEAANGMAWIALANHQDEKARSGFNAALARDPGNAEALAGIAGSNNQRRFQLDISGGPLHNNAGTAWGGGAQLIAALDATSSLEVAARHNTRELPTANPVDSTTLPSNLLRLGYRWQVPGRYGFGIAYEYRDRKDDPTEQRVDVTANARINNRFQVFGGIRKGFGTGWNSRVVHAGVTAGITGPWEVAATVFSERHARFGSAQVVALDLIRQGPGDALLVVGASRGNNPRLTDVHGSVVIPVGKDRAVTLTARHNSFNSESQVELGWRQYWK